MHAIEYLTFGSRKAEKTVAKECSRYADSNGDYKGQARNIRFFEDKVFKSYLDAVNWIDAHDRGWYDCIAVKYMENRKKYWLVKIEYHC